MECCKSSFNNALIQKFIGGRFKYFNITENNIEKIVISKCDSILPLVSYFGIGSVYDNWTITGTNNKFKLKMDKDRLILIETINLILDNKTEYSVCTTKRAIKLPITFKAKNCDFNILNKLLIKTPIMFDIFENDENVSIHAKEIKGFRKIVREWKHGKDVFFKINQIYFDGERLANFYVGELRTESCTTAVTFIDFIGMQS